MCKKLLWLVAGALLATVCSGVKVTRLSVPSTYILDESSMGGKKPLILDCEYEMEANESGFVLKWFLNGQTVYQWIANSKPFAFGAMKTKIDTTYEVSKEEKQKHRAMVITQPAWNMTGEYTCSVQTFSSSDKRTAKLQIIAPEKEFELDVNCCEEEHVSVKCTVTGIFPKPRLSITMGERHVPGEVTDNEAERAVDGLFDVTVKANMARNTIPTPSPIRCHLEVPETDYKRQREFIFNEVTTTTTLTYKDGELDDSSEITRLEAVLGSNDGKDHHGNSATSLVSSTVLILVTAALWRLI